MAKTDLVITDRRSGLQLAIVEHERSRLGSPPLDPDDGTVGCNETSPSQPLDGELEPGQVEPEPLGVSQPPQRWQVSLP